MDTLGQRSTVREQGATVANKGLIVVMGAAVVGLAGCAASPARPEADFSRAQTLIQSAEQQGAPEFAAADLERARGKLNQAEIVAEQGNGEQAARLAQEAAVDAELAAARAAAAKARKAADELDQSLETLRSEAQRAPR
jgi:hypothetical protein